MDGFIPLLLLLALFWFLLILPNRRRAQAAAKLHASLAPGMRVMTQSGQFGTVVSLTDDQVTLEVAPGVQTEWVRPAIASIVTTPEPKE
jgi:preprotein translocase subunit YajC